MDVPYVTWLCFVKLRRLPRKLETVIGILCILMIFNLLQGLIFQRSWSMITPSIGSSRHITFWNNSVQYDVVLTERTLNFHESQNRAISELVFPHPYDYIISNSDFCSRGTKGNKLALVILVCSSPGNFLQRKTIRQTWGRSSAISNNSGTLRISFLLGKTNDSVVQTKIMEESALYSDIMQEDFSDSYRNLTIKSVMLLKWATTFCPNVHFVMKADDDIFINIPYLLKVLGQRLHRSNVIYGKLLHKPPPVRDVLSKWFVSKSQYESEVFPDHLSGAGYIMSRDTIPKLLESSYFLPFLPVEDVFITGMCASRARVKLMEIKGFFSWTDVPKSCALKDAVTKHHVTPNEMKTIWMELRNVILFCKTLRNDFWEKFFRKSFLIL